jgi:hypothetical protein
MEHRNAVKQYRIWLQKPFDVYCLRAALMARRLPQRDQTNQLYAAVTV